MTTKDGKYQALASIFRICPKCGFPMARMISYGLDEAGEMARKEEIARCFRCNPPKLKADA